MFHSFVRTLPVMQEDDIGSSFILDEFTSAEVFLKTISDTLYVELANYDARTKSLVFQDKGVFKAVPPNLLSEFSFDERKFVNSSELSSYPDPIRVFLERAYSSNAVNVYIDYEVDVIAPSYNVAMDVGSKSAKISTEEVFHLNVNDDWFLKFSTKKKYIKENFGDQANDVLAFIKKEKLQNKLDDVIRVADFLVAQGN